MPEGMPASLDGQTGQRLLGYPDLVAFGSRILRGLASWQMR